MDEPTKRCPVCKRDLPRTQFFKAANRKDGLYGYCKECHGRDGKARRDRLMAAGGNPVKRATKYCPKCEQTLPSSDFYVHRSASDGLANKCKACCKIYNDGRYHNVNKLNPSYKAHVKEYAARWYERTREHHAERIAANHRKEREACLVAYGGMCACCGERQFEFLAIHHINGGGRQHRKKVGGKMSRWLVRNGFPRDLGLGVLCHNCNMAVGFYGICPHQRDKESK